MLKTKLLQPDILRALAAAGHNSKVLIADGNYPISTTLGPRAVPVYMNLSPGVVSATEVLEAIAASVPIESAAVMLPRRSGPYGMKNNPPIWAEFDKILKKHGNKVEIEELKIQEFYAMAAGPDVALSVATGERRIYANILLKIGAILPD
ncbi:MAG TPA: RbsD/FucU family protein [bacterium]|nr:RbsD/FucU family protein [bacterium]